MVVFIFFGVASAEETPALPDIPGWVCGELKVARFDAVSGNYGYWQERDYRTPGGIGLKAVLMYGNGPKFYNLPPNGVASNDLPVGSGATYEIILLKGYRSLIEYHPTLGYSVAVNAFEKKYTLTVECGPFEKRGDVLRTVEEILGFIK